MLRWRKRIRKMTYLTTDLITIVVASIITGIMARNTFKTEIIINPLEFIGLISLLIVLVVVMDLLLQIFDETIEDRGLVKVKTLIKMLLTYGVSILLLSISLFYMNVAMPRIYIGILLLTIVVLTLINRIVLSFLVFRNNAQSESVKNILVVGQSEKGAAYIEEIRKHEYLSINIVGYVSIKEAQTYPNLRHIGNLDDLGKIAEDFVIDEIAVARPLSYDKRIAGALENCQEMGITVSMLLDTHNAGNTKAQVAMVGNVPVLKFHTVSLNETQIFIKRGLDVCGAMVGMVFFAIAYIVVGPLIKLETPGPVIFKQDRVGKNGRVFKVWKFRSMGADAETRKAALMSNNEMTGHMFKMTNDPRVTKVGAFIRRTSIDELPQFWNVLKGDMSLVGTRPPTVKEVHNYQRHHRRRISIIPGITGKWQVSGRSDIADFEEVVRLDSEYIANWSVWTDIKILLKTIQVVFTRKGSR